MEEKEGRLLKCRFAPRNAGEVQNRHACHDAGTPQCRRIEVGIISKEATFATRSQASMRDVEITPTSRHGT